MSFPPQLPAQVTEFTGRVKSVLGDLFRRAAELRVRLQQWLLFGKRRLFLIASMGGVAFIMLAIGILHSFRNNPVQQFPAAAVSEQRIIAPDELFLPDEPDFVPGILLEREQRSMWTAEDAESLWQDPLKSGEEPWRNRIEKTIDEIMESVP